MSFFNLFKRETHEVSTQTYTKKTCNADNCFLNPEETLYIHTQMLKLHPIVIELCNKHYKILSPISVCYKKTIQQTQISYGINPLTILDSKPLNLLNLSNLRMFKEQLKLIYGYLLEFKIQLKLEVILSKKCDRLNWEQDIITENTRLIEKLCLK